MVIGITCIVYNNVRSIIYSNIYSSSKLKMTCICVNDILLIVCCIAVVYLVWSKCINTTDGFDNKPNAEQMESMSQTMLTHNDKFDRLDKARKYMPWIDAITFEDSRKLIRDGNFTKQNILKILG